MVFLFFSNDLGNYYENHMLKKAGKLSQMGNRNIIKNVGTVLVALYHCFYGKVNITLTPDL